MGALFSSPATPKAPPLPPEAPAPAKPYNNQTQKDKDTTQQRAAQGGRPDTILTTPGGLATQATTAKKTLLGT